MLEAVLITCLFYAFQLMPIRGKSYQDLNPKQAKVVGKHYKRYLKSWKGKKNSNLTIEEFMPIVSKNARIYLTSGLVILPIYILIVFFYYI